MFRTKANKVALASSALLLCAAIAHAQTASPLTATPTSVSIGYVLGTGPGTPVPTSLSVPTGTSGSIPFVIDQTTVPFWLTTQNASAVALTSGSVAAGTPVAVYFVATSYAGSMSAGAYVANVGFAVNGYSELIVQVTLTVTGGASTLSVVNNGTPVATAGTVPLTWTYGAAASTIALPLTLFSSNDPIPFSATSAVTSNGPEDWIEIVNPNGIAYNYGSTLNITFAQDALTNATVGSQLTGSITINYGASSQYVVNIDITVGEPAPAVSSIFPRETAPLSATSFLYLVVTGTGFGTTTQGFTTATSVSLTYGPTGTPSAVLGQTGGVLAAGLTTVVNPTTMILKIPAQDATSGTPIPLLTSAAVGNPVTIAITNGTYGSASPATLYVSTNPIIDSIADAAALVEPTPGQNPNVAPYELISIFGNNFCTSCGSTPVIASPSENRYPTSLTAPASGGEPLTVTFYKTLDTASTLTDSDVIAQGYILFASNTQINVLVPSTVAVADNPMQVVVGYGPTGSVLVSNSNVSYAVTAAQANPGIFTASSNGQGQGAILVAGTGGTVTVNSSGSASTEVAEGGTIEIYASGLGIPNSAAADTASATKPSFPNSCVSVASYVTTAGLTSPSTADGAVLNPADIETNLYPPCFSSSGSTPVTVGVTVAGQTATVTYAGWVSGSVAGLYQINATVPTSTKVVAGSNAIELTVTYGSGTSKTVYSSQGGVTVAVK